MSASDILLAPCFVNVPFQKSKYRRTHTCTWEAKWPQKPAFFLDREERQYTKKVTDTTLKVLEKGRQQST